MHLILMTRRAYIKDSGDAKIYAVKYFRDSRRPREGDLRTNVDAIEAGPQFLCTVPFVKRIAKPQRRADPSYEEYLTHHPKKSNWGCVIAAFGFTT